MRILQVIESFGAGSMQVVLTISERLAADGHQIAIAHGSVPESPRDAQSLVVGDIEFFPLRWTRTGLSQLRVARELRQIARAWGPDVIHLHSSFAGVVGAGALQGIAPLVYTPHGYSFTRRYSRTGGAAFFRTLERMVARRVDIVGVVSESEAEQAHEIGAPRVTVVPNGIPELEHPQAMTNVRCDPPRVVALGRIDPARQPAAAARILRSIVDVATPEWIGGGPPAAVEAMRDAGVPVSGWLDRQAVLRRLSGATACLHWSAWDAQALSILEAMAQDVVVVASDIPANREMLGARQVCGTEWAAGQLLRTVVTDPRVCHELLAEQGVRRRRYSASRMVRDWLEIYWRLSSPAGRPVRA